MEVQGKLIHKLEPTKGTSSKGEWTKQDIVIETNDKFPKNICISFMKDVDKIQAVEIGSTLTVHINIESREYNGKYYTNVNGWKFESKSQPETQSHKSANFVEPDLTPSNDSVDDLPF